ncbi:B-cell receptor CD22-like [Thunnus maccoyii]|uniref:B-cell receptor CD22-like n=1 Tax=Thunnus maccoyii TaxID=8240 RepID=UPI001C4C50DC|nr:B-cell receptor CD22-like [Thunnus maccoyii]
MVSQRCYCCCLIRYNKEKVKLTYKEVRMAVWDKKIPWSFMLFLAGVAGEGVNYPPPVCAVKGSTVTLPCTFTPLKSFNQSEKQVPLRIVRVRWCVNHDVCQGPTPSVYDSRSTMPDSRYRYLGDKKGNCTLQIRDIQMIDNAIFYFRMEADNPAGHFTGVSGVRVRVTEPFRMRIKSCSDAGELRRNQNVTLSCTTTSCTFHQLEVTWFKDGSALPQSGPALQLGPLTAKDSGNYTCGLKTDTKTISPPYAVHVKEAEEKEKDEVTKLLIVRVVLFTLHTVLIVIATAIIIKRTCVRKKAAAAENSETCEGGVICELSTV